MNEASFILDTSLLEPLERSTLFYPCSGNDLITPITLFSPYISNFWFVDRGYFTPGHQDTRFYGLDAPADEQPPLLADNPLYRLLDTRIKGRASQRRKVDIDPCILTERYEHLATGKNNLYSQAAWLWLFRFPQRRSWRSWGVFLPRR